MFKLLEEKMDYYYRAFKNWAMGLNGNAFNLDDSKDEISSTFYQRFAKGDFEKITTLANAILKSYLGNEKKESEVKSFIMPEDLKFKQVAVINKFMNDYVVSEPVHCKNANDVYLVIAKTLADKVEEIFGDFIFTPIVKPGFKVESNIKKAMMDSLQKKGYVPNEKDNQFLFRKNPENVIVINVKNQKILAETYIEVLKEYIEFNMVKYISERISKEKYDNFFADVHKCLENIEKRMSKETLSLPNIATAREKIEKFFCEDKERVRKKITISGRNGDYYNTVKNCLDRYNKNEYGIRDEKILKSFYERVYLTNKALEKVDDNGQNYPSNYFACIPIHPTTLRNLLIYFQKSEFLTEKEKDTISNLKVAMGKAFNTFHLSGVNNGVDFKAFDVLKSYKIRRQFANGVVVDLTDDQNYKEFTDKVQKYAEENNLPSSVICFQTLAKDMIKDRQPLNLSKDEISALKELDEVDKKLDNLSTNNKQNNLEKTV